MDGNPLRSIALLLIAVNVGLALWIIFRRDARWAMALWAVVLFFTPVYITFSVQGVALTILDAVTILALASGVQARGLRWSIVDTLMVAAFVAIVAGLAFGAVSGHVTYTVLSWLLPYAWGRVVVVRVGFDWVARCLSAAAVIAAALAIVEFAVGTNIFVSLPGVQGAMWTNLQYRGGLLRAEGAFGHSISLGSSLAISTAFLLAVRWRTAWKTAALVVVISGTVMTFSRIGMIGIVLVIVFSVLFLGRVIRRSQRILMALLVGVALLVALPFITVVFDDAGDEAAGSAEYRADLYPLLFKMAQIGMSPSREVAADGTDRFAGFRSIDSALILTGLRHGALPLAIFLVMLAVCAWVVLSGRGNAAAVAVLCQVPALATVALITQYAQFVWFAAGVAVASYSVDRDRGRSGGATGAEPRREVMEAR